MEKFLKDLSNKIWSNLSNDHKNNWDFHRFGTQPVVSVDTRIKNEVAARLKALKHYINATGFHYFKSEDNGTDGLQSFYFLYDILETTEDRDLLVTLLAYRILGHRKIKLPLNTQVYWGKLKQAEGLEDKSETIYSGFMNFQLALTDLRPIGFPIRLFFSPAGVMADFVVEQYKYEKGGVKIAVEPGDAVIDGGACFGDTALYFAHAAGTSGKVFSFEFIPNNILIWRKNIALNSELSSSCELVPAPIWSSSDQPVYYKANGPASVVSFDHFDGHDGVTKTITLDDFVHRHNIQKLDFIKLDIEGAELNALKGATGVLKKYKPKLAVALYHRGKDFKEIPEFINSLNCGYRFFLNHSTIHQEETILFALAR